MAAKKFLRLVSGKATEILGIQTSAGAANAGDIAVLNDSGVWDTSLMPPGIAADTQVVTASEALAANDLVNVWDSSGAKARKADASTDKRCTGFVIAAVSNGQPATVYPFGSNAGLTGLTPGVLYLSTTPGVPTSTPPSGAGNIVQTVGWATSATAMIVLPGTVYQLV